MDDPCGVSFRQPFRQLMRQGDQPRHRQATGGEQRAQRIAVHPLHREVGKALLASDVVNGEDVRVVQRGRGARFLLEAPEAVSIGRDVGAQDLDRDRAVQPRIARLGHLAHSAGADRRENFVWPQAGSGGEAHGKRETVYCRLLPLAGALLPHSRLRPAIGLLLHARQASGRWQGCHQRQYGQSEGAQRRRSFGLADSAISLSQAG